MRVGSLFAGIGGFDLGLERAGMHIVWQVECDPSCINVLERHWPDVHRRRDVRLASAANLGPCDLIAGGFPCQDISAAGKGAGLDAGHRSGLWREFARIVRELQPRWVLVENVPALRRRGADTVLGDLEAAGYACWPLVVGARHVGAPHRRDRVWIVGRLADGDGLRCEAIRPSRLYAPERDASRHDLDGRHRAVGLADAEGDRWPAERQRGDAQEPVAVGLDDTDAGRCGLTPHALPARWDFPASPGGPQYKWEAPRTVESPLGRAAHGLSSRLASRRWRDELKALGNSVVPQVVEAIGRAILAVDREERIAS
jgi:DNA (cytosine-5)-methyltransferase 1